MSRQEVLVFGASGYTGLELLRLLARHPSVNVVAASSSTWAAEPVCDRVPEWPTTLSFEPHDVVLAKATGRKVAMLATPAKTSAELAPVLLDRGLSVVDLSGAYRLEKNEDVKEWYGFDHARPELLALAEYGLVELFPPRSGAAAGPRLVSNPGCYATAAILAAAPLLATDLVPHEAPIVIDGKSGVTGAGRTLDEKFLFSEVAESVRPYRVGKHQHTPEIERALSRLAKRSVRVAMTAHLIPMRRGLIASVYVPARPNVTQARIDEAYAGAYAGHGFIRVQKARPPETGNLTGNNYVEISATLDPRTSTIVAFGALDNLVKGAAGQAIQNLNSILELPLGTGLASEQGT